MQDPAPVEVSLVQMNIQLLCQESQRLREKGVRLVAQAKKVRDEIHAAYLNSWPHSPERTVSLKGDLLVLPGRP